MKSIAFVYLGAGTYFGQPIGLLCLSAWINKYCSEWNPSIVDDSCEDAFKILTDNNYDIIAISAMTPQYEKAKMLASRLKSIKCKSEIIIGGVHISTLPESFEACFDRMVAGEGEIRLQNYLNGSSINNDVDLKEYPDLDYSLLHKNYFNPRPIRVWRDVVVESMVVASRGCPFDCRFCSTTNFWKKYRAHSPEWVIRQVINLSELGVTHIQFVDDLFTANKKWLRRFVELFESKKVSIKGVSIQSRTDTFDSEVVELLKSIRCKNVNFGLESGSPKTLRYLKKTEISIDDNRRSLLLAKKNKIQTLGSFMIGNPGETLVDMFQTIRFIIWGLFNGLSDAVPFVTTVYPGTEFWKVAKEKGIVSDKMNFNILALRSKGAGRALLSEIPKWQFIIIWYLIQLVVLPFKIKKATKLLISMVKSGGYHVR